MSGSLLELNPLRSRFAVRGLAAVVEGRRESAGSSAKLSTYLYICLSIYLSTYYMYIVYRI